MSSIEVRHHQRAAARLREKPQPAKFQSQKSDLRLECPTQTETVDSDRTRGVHPGVPYGVQQTGNADGTSTPFPDGPTAHIPDVVSPNDALAVCEWSDTAFPSQSGIVRAQTKYFVFGKWTNIQDFV